MDIKTSSPPQGAMKAAPKPAWTPSELDRRARAESGQAVVANMHKGKDTALIAWAKANGRYVRIDRTTEWGNRFEMRDYGGDRETVCDLHAEEWPLKTDLHARTPTLRGMVLCCWCFPLRCHGDVIAATANAMEEK